MTQTSINLADHNIILQELGGKYPRYALYTPEDFFKKYKNYLTLKQLGARFDISLPNGPTYTYPNFKIPLLKETLERIILGILPSIDDLKGPEIIEIDGDPVDLPPKLEFLETAPIISTETTTNTDDIQLTNKDLQVIGDMEQKVKKKVREKKVVAPGKIIKRMANEKFSTVQDIQIVTNKPIIATELGEIDSYANNVTYAKPPIIFDMIQQEKGEADFIYEQRLKYYNRCLEMGLTTDLSNMYSRAKTDKVFNNNGYNQFIENELIIIFGE